MMMNQTKTSPDHSRRSVAFKAALMCLSLYLVTFSGAVASAQGRHDGRGIFKIVQLTAEQRKQVQAINQKYRPSLEEKRARMNSSQQELDGALQSDQPEKSIMEKFEALRKEEDTFARERFKKILEIRAILSPEQRVKFNEAHQGRRRGKGGGRGHGPQGQGMGGDCDANPADT